MSVQVAFLMRLRPGFAEEYRRRHDAIWPELVDLLRAAGVSGYSIFHDPETDALFAVLRRRDAAAVEALKDAPMMRRWWAMMADIMETHPDGEPVTRPLVPMFRLG